MYMLYYGYYVCLVCYVGLAICFCNGGDTYVSQYPTTLSADVVDQDSLHTLIDLLCKLLL
jgi:hypothetical protein